VTGKGGWYIFRYEKRPPPAQRSCDEQKLGRAGIYGRGRLGVSSLVSLEEKSNITLYHSNHSGARGWEVVIFSELDWIGAAVVGRGVSY